MQISNKTALSYFRFHFILALQERYRLPVGRQGGTTRRAKSSVALYRLTFITKDASKELTKPKKTSEQTRRPNRQLFLRKRMHKTQTLSVQHNSPRFFK